MSAKHTPLAGIRILDLSQGIAGPYAAGILAQQGAEVIKVEPPQGDWARLMGAGRDGMTAMSIACNLGKRSLCVDARHSDGAALLRRLARRVDVVLESFRPGVLAKLGLDEVSLRQENPGLIYTSITGFGEDGPYRDQPGADSVIQALSGMMWMNRDRSGQPQRVGMMLIDVTTGCYTAQGITAALLQRGSTGQGKHLSYSLLGVAGALQSISILDQMLHTEHAPVPVTVPSGTFRTADGCINLTTLRDRMFHGLARALDRPEWIEHSNYRSNEDRIRHADRLNAEIRELVQQRTTAEWVARFSAEDVLCAPVLDYPAFLAHPQVRHAGLFTDIAQTPWGTLPVARLPDAEAASPESAPKLAQHTRDILVEAGLTHAQIDALRHSGTVFEPDDLLNESTEKDLYHG